VDHARENLLRLMASAGLSVRQVAEKSGLDERTIRGILNGGNKPHPQTIRRLADGLRVKVDEFFLDPVRLLYRHFDRQPHPLVTAIFKTDGFLFDGWTEADFKSLHKRIDAGEMKTVEHAIQTVCRMNRKRQLHERLDLVLESRQAEVAVGILNVLYADVAAEKE
jgi:transcriptional regulator with XRE-family HTH domain